MTLLKNLPDKIDTTIRFLLYVLVLVIPISNAAVEICVSFSGVLWLIKRGYLITQARQRHRLSVKEFFKILRPAKTILDIPIAVFLLVCILSCLVNPNTGEKLADFFTKTLEWFAVFYFFAETITRRKHFQILFGSFLVTTAVTAVDSLIQYYITGVDLLRGREITRGGACAAFNHANCLGAYLITAVPLMLAVGMSKVKKKIKMINAGILGLMLWSLIITYSRAAWISLGCALLLFVFLCRKKKLFVRLVAVLAVILLAVLILPDSFLKPFRLDQQSFQDTFSWRQDLWEDTMIMIGYKPWLGHGINTYMRLFQEYRRKAFEGIPYVIPQPYSPTYAHNCYLQIAAEVGMLGLLSFLWIFFRLGRNSFRMIQQGFQKQNRHVIVYAGLIAGIAAFMIHSFFDTDLFSLRLGVYFWMILGLAVNFMRVHNQQS